MSGGFKGPMLKREEDRIRRNTPDVPVDKLHTDTARPVAPPHGIPDCHYLANDWYNSLANSAQSVYYEESDWQAARICAFAIHIWANQARPSPEMYKAIQSAFTSLLATEGDRRRLRLEIIRNTGDKNTGASTAEALMREASERYQKMFEEQK